MMEHMIVLLVFVLWFGSCFYFQWCEWRVYMRQLQSIKDIIQENEVGADAELEEQFCMHGSCFTCSSVSCYTGQLYREHGKDAALEFLKQFDEMEDVED